MTQLLGLHRLALALALVGATFALVLPGLGLLIAIPALMFYRYFRGRVDEFQLGMELASERIVPHLMRFAVRGAA